MTTMASTQQTELSSTLYHFRLGESEIASLLNIASEGIQASEISVSTLIDNIRFSEESLSDLKTAVQASNLPNRNRPWPTISLEAGSQTSARSVKITLNSALAYINVAGTSPNWVHGRTARLNEFLVAHGATPHSRKDEPKIIGLFLLMFVTIGYFWIFKTQDPETARECLARAAKSRENQGLFNWTMGILLGGGLIAVLFLWLRYRASRIFLDATGIAPVGSWWSRLSSGDRIAAIGVPIAAIGMIATLMSGISDTLGK
jgi:hypothetical protein